MDIKLIRNATMKINFSEKVILTDPMLGKKHSVQSFAGIEENPTVELKEEVSSILNGVDFILASHFHPDHFDEEALKVIDKETAIYCQPGDENHYLEAGFKNVFPVETEVEIDGIKIRRTSGKHGKGEILKMLGEVSGFILEAKNEPTTYWIGDSILCEEVREVLKSNKLDVIVTHSGRAVIPGYDAILMDDKETIEIAKMLPEAKVVAIHMDSLDHCPITRKVLGESVKKEEIKNILIPADGETIKL